MLMANLILQNSSLIRSCIFGSGPAEIVYEDGSSDFRWKPKITLYLATRRRVFEVSIQRGRCWVRSVNW